MPHLSQGQSNYGYILRTIAGVSHGSLLFLHFCRGLVASRNLQVIETVAGTTFSRLMTRDGKARWIVPNVKKVLYSQTS